MIVSMVSTFVAPITIMITIILVNMRHILYGTTLGPYMRGWKSSSKFIAALGLTDEIFALISSKVRTEQKLSAPYYICFAIPSYISWILGTIAGVAVGSFVPNELSDILSFTLPALFLALLFSGEKSISYLLSAGVGAIVAITMDMIGFGGVGLILGGLVGATSGYAYHQKQKKYRVALQSSAK
ncbi:Inner membrane protein YgaZ [compost metagenome]